MSAVSLIWPRDIGKPHADLVDQLINRGRLQPYEHQIEGVNALVNGSSALKSRVYDGCILLADEMGAGKTKQVIDAAQVLYERGQISRVVVVSPAAVRGVWFDPEFGELARHLWEGLPAQITEYHGDTRTWKWNKPVAGQKVLSWVITNYEFIRNPVRLERLMRWSHAQTLLVLDESSSVAHYRAQQSKACLKLRRQCGRIVLLNGTPLDTPGDLFSQFNILHPGILACKSYTHFLARYAIKGGYLGKQILAWQNLEDLQRRAAPYVIRRLKEHCLDLPPKLSPVTLLVPLDKKTWRIYTDMRDELITWLDETTMATAAQAGARVMRLAQITAGFLGGVETDPQLVIPPTRPNQADWEVPLEMEIPVAGSSLSSGMVREVGDEKLTMLIEWIGARLEEVPGFKLVLWCRFRPELERLSRVIKEKYPQVIVHRLWGSQSREERKRAIVSLKPSYANEKPTILVGTPATGAMGIDMSAAHTVVYASNGYSLRVRLQADDRVHRPGQKNPVSYFDVIATGPNGQKTIDHTIIKALRAKHDLASWTCTAWVSELRKELES